MENNYIQILDDSVQLYGNWLDNGTNEVVKSYKKGGLTYRIENNNIKFFAYSDFFYQNAIMSYDLPININGVEYSDVQAITKALDAMYPENTEGGGSGSSINVDSFLSLTSTNPVQNKVIASELDNKADKDELPSLDNYALKSEIPTIPLFKTINGQPITGSTDNIVIEGGSGADLSNYYTKTESDSKYALKGDVPTDDVYTKTQVDSKLSEKLDVTAYTAYDDSEIRQAISNKQDKGEYVTYDEFSSMMDLYNLKINSLNERIKKLEDNDGGEGHEPPTPDTGTTPTDDVVARVKYVTTVPNERVKLYGYLGENSTFKVDGNIFDSNSQRYYAFKEPGEYIGELIGDISGCSFIFTNNITEVYLNSEEIPVSFLGFNQELKKVTFSDKVKVYKGSFGYCNKLTDIDFGNIEEISAFWDMEAIQEITLPSTLKKIIGDFKRVPNLTTINYEGTAEQWYMIDKLQEWINQSVNVITSEGPIDYYAPKYGSGYLVKIKYNIPKGYTSYTLDNLNDYAGEQSWWFVDGQRVPDANTNRYLFKEAGEHYATFIGTAPSYNSQYVTDLDVIDGHAFDGNGSTADILENVTIHNSYSIKNFGCKSLRTVSFFGDRLNIIWSSTFSNTEHLNEIELPNSVTTIGSEAFQNSGLFSIVLPNSLEKISNSVFRYCKNLGSITLPDSVTSIGEFAFEGCSTLTSVTIGNNVTNIYNYAFSNCTLLNNIIFNGSIEEWNNIKTYKHTFENTPQLEYIQCTDGKVNLLKDNTKG